MGSSASLILPTWPAGLWRPADSGWVRLAVADQGSASRVGRDAMPQTQQLTSSPAIHIRSRGTPDRPQVGVNSTPLAGWAPNACPNRKETHIDRHRRSDERRPPRGQRRAQAQGLGTGLHGPARAEAARQHTRSQGHRRHAQGPAHRRHPVRPGGQSTRSSSADAPAAQTPSTAPPTQTNGRAPPRGRPPVPRRRGQRTGRPPADSHARTAHPVQPSPTAATVPRPAPNDRCPR